MLRLEKGEKMGLGIGTVGPINPSLFRVDEQGRPQVDTVWRVAKSCEEKGYHSVWYADHLMGWFPPHDFYDPIATLAFVASRTEKIKIGTSVTDPIRRNPVMLSQSMLTLDHISRGRCIFGLGTGEAMNYTPYGMEYSKQVGKFEEALRIIRLSWEAGRGNLVNFEGKFWKLKNAPFDLLPYGEKPPPIWVAAHGPRMLRVVGELADGWLPMMMTPQEYGEKAEMIREAAERVGRKAAEITLALYAPLVIAETREECLKMMENPVLKGYALTLPPSAYERRGLKHPLGERFNPFADFIFTELSERVVEAVQHIPTDLAAESFVYGTPEEVVETLKLYAEKGAEVVVLWNQTPFADPSKTGTSYRLIDEVVRRCSRL